jgi:hypothetical protein
MRVCIDVQLIDAWTYKRPCPDTYLSPQCRRLQPVHLFDQWSKGLDLIQEIIYRGVLTRWYLSSIWTFCMFGVRFAWVCQVTSVMSAFHKCSCSFLHLCHFQTARKLQRWYARAFIHHILKNYLSNCIDHWVCASNGWLTLFVSDITGRLRPALPRLGGWGVPFGLFVFLGF